jgi:GT2 family glycosyltransferase
VDEIIIVDNGGTVADHDDARIIRPSENLGVSGRNVGAREATGDLLLMLDDDSFPLPGTIETLRGAFERDPRLGVVGGLIRDVDRGGKVLKEQEVGTFDWFLRAGRGGEVPANGWPAFFYPEGGCMFRREAFLDVGGYLAPLFFVEVEVELATRLIAAGWDVRYLPTAVFDHLKGVRTVPSARVCRQRVRNQLWYFWLHFPPGLAARRMAAYLANYFIECAYHRQVGSWFGGIGDAWRDRDLVREYRKPLPRNVLRRAELNRGRLHVRLLVTQLLKRVS